MSFRSYEKELFKHGSFKIITQRPRKHFKTFFSKNSKSDDIELITVDRKERQLNFFETNYGLANEELINDEIFKNSCINAMKLCQKYIYIFYVLEKFSFLVEQFSSIFSIIVAFCDISTYKVVCICTFIFIVVVLNSFGDWARLREKYSNLYKLFGRLANSKDENRIKKFENYATTFSAEHLSIDSVSPIRGHCLYEENTFE